MDYWDIRQKFNSNYRERRLTVGDNVKHPIYKNTTMEVIATDYMGGENSISACSWRIQNGDMKFDIFFSNELELVDNHE